MLSPPSLAPSTWIRAVVPPLCGWRSYRGAMASLLIFGFAALGCEWLVHQVQYLIQYGNRFGAVMAGTPHRLYMAPIGVFLFVVGAAIAALLAVSLSAAGSRHRALLERLPARLRRSIPAHPIRLPWAAVGQTMLALAACQMAIYFVQENLEYVSVTGAWPGLWVFLAPSHLTVIPLHLLAALSSSVLLWTVFGLLRRSRHVAYVAGVLLALIDRPSGVPTRLTARAPLLPSLRPRAGDLGLRSPPLLGI